MPLIKNKRQMLLKACGLIGAHRWWGRLDRWRGLVTLNYHRIGDPTRTPIDPGVFSATAEQFEEQLKFLKSDCDVVSVADLPEVLRPGSKRRSVLMTFDDGYLDNYELAFPVLKQVGLPAVIFLATGFLDQRNVAWWDEIAWIARQTKATVFELPMYWGIEKLDRSSNLRESISRRCLRLAKTLSPEELSRFLNDIGEAAGTGRVPQNAETAPWMTWDMVREMHRGGIEFGGHTVTHPVLSFCTLEQQRSEIEQSKARIEAELGRSISAFSYPIGQPWSYSDATVRLTREAGYQWGFSFYPGYSTSQSGPYDLRRVAMEPLVSLQEIQAITQMPRLFAR